ncbi:hypothetical protein R0J93_23850, partial [Pseudoalteromonas sp. SIMBA_148]
DDDARAQSARDAFESALSARNLEVLGWRDMPVDDSVCGPRARDCLPRIRQVFVGAADERTDIAFNVDLFMARRYAEQALKSEEDFYVCS